MSYQVLARKWRPRTFEELIGQEHIVRALANALDNNRLHHAFLFTGTRGVGKTTIARILAKSLNCEQGVSATPCGSCSSCRQIDEGRFVDLIEVDAASRTKVEDTRELLENVQYAPTRGRYKVYLIDEVHMLSGHSFNALLKTLEEPPPHVKFLLATTDPQRLPVTVLSRCLLFNLRRLPASLIAAHLRKILESEGITCETGAAEQLARAGDGSVRDALSLLDQAIAFGGSRISCDDVNAMLGSIDQRWVIRLLEALATGDARNLLFSVAELDRAAPDYQGLLADLILLLQRIAVFQTVPETEDETWSDGDAIRRLAAALTPEDVQLFYQIALIGRRDLPLTPEPRGGFEMLLLRMLCFRPIAGEASPRTSAEQPAALPPTPPISGAPATAPPQTSTPGRSAAPIDSSHSDWGDTVAALGLNGIAQQLALNCVPARREGNTLHLLLAPSHAQTRTKNAEERLRAALSEHYRENLNLVIQVGKPDTATPAQQLAQQQADRLQAAAEAIHADPNVRALCDTFDGHIKPDSIKPAE